VAQVAGVVAFNDALESAYDTAGDPVAGVEAALAVTDLAPVAGTPLDVTRAHANGRRFCAPPPLGPDIDANRGGYAVIALKRRQPVGEAPADPTISAAKPVWRWSVRARSATITRPVRRDAVTRGPSPETRLKLPVARRPCGEGPPAAGGLGHPTDVGRVALRG